MPVVYETKYIRRDFGWDGESTSKFGGRVVPAYKSIDKLMNALVDELNGERWEIKSIIPLTASSYYCEGNSGGYGTLPLTGGAGYGAAVTCGVMILCQRATEMSAEEFATREATLKAAAEEKRAAEAVRQAAAAKVKAGKDAIAAIRAEDIEVVHKGLFKAKFAYGGVEYASIDEAKAAREAKAIAAEAAAAQKI